MAFHRASSWQTPRQDTGWGLIFRLNDLLKQIELDISNGNIDKWNLRLDRIYVNILYKNPEEILEDENGKIQDVRFTKEDTEVFVKLNEQINNIKNKINEINSDPDNDKRELSKLKQDLYNAIFKKDVWMRKKLFKMNLYLREVEHDPRKAIFSG